MADPAQKAASTISPPIPLKDLDKAIRLWLSLDPLKEVWPITDEEQGTLNIVRGEAIRQIDKLNLGGHLFKRGELDPATRTYWEEADNFIKIYGDLPQIFDSNVPDPALLKDLEKQKAEADVRETSADDQQRIARQLQIKRLLNMGLSMPEALRAVEAGVADTIIAGQSLSPVRSSSKTATQTKAGAQKTGGTKATTRFDREMAWRIKNAELQRQMGAYSILGQPLQWFWMRAAGLKHSVIGKFQGYKPDYSSISSPVQDSGGEMVGAEGGGSEDSSESPMPQSYGHPSAEIGPSQDLVSGHSGGSSGPSSKSSSHFTPSSLGGMGKSVGGKIAGAKNLTAKAKEAVTAAKAIGSGFADLKSDLQLLKQVLGNKYVQKGLKALKVAALGGGLYGWLLLVDLAAKVGTVASIAAGAVGGAALGAVVGSIIPGVGTLVGAGIGAVVGGTVGFFAGLAGGAGIFGSGTAIAGSTSLASISSVTAATTTTLTAGGIGTAGGFLGGALSTSATVAVGSLIPLTVGGVVGISILGQQQKMLAFIAPVEDTKLIRVQKTVDQPFLPNNPNTSLVYKVEVTTNSEDPLVITIEEVGIKITPEQTGLALVMPEPSGPLPTSVSKAAPVTVTFNPLKVAGAAFNDSILTNTVKVSVTNEDGEIVETQEATASVMIGDQMDPPYGYPLSGAITSLDDEEILAPSLDKDADKSSLIRRSHSSFGVPGGLDISARGSSDTTVNSTLTGKVIRSSFEPQTYGGRVEIQAGNYVARFLHLTDAGRPAEGSVVVRGQSLGSIYPGYLADATAPHLHYQVLKDGRNVYFGRTGQSAKGQQNFGPCRINGVRTNFIQPAPPLPDRPVSVVRMTECSNE